MIEGTTELLPEFEPEPEPLPDEPEPEVLPEPEPVPLPEDPEPLPDPDPLPDPEVKVNWSRLDVAEVPADVVTEMSTVPVTPEGVVTVIELEFVTVKVAAVVPK
ncbi:MAG: hypothetical protein JWP89_6813 [Schlesneria sp.]|nr:hypothetical protein [Schlesneria sp.]